MKKLKAIIAGAFFSICFLSAGAQNQTIPLNEPDYNKPKIFDDLPQKMLLRIADVERLFFLATGTITSVQASDSFLLKGTIVSKADGPTKSVVLKCNNRANVFFTFSKVVKPDGGFTYAGRLLSRDNGDAYEIKQEAEQYFLIKKNLYDLINE